jgi:hypothetical protein
MAKYERTDIMIPFDELREMIADHILQGSISASLEDTSEFNYGDARCEVLVFERFSIMGSNRVSLNVTLFQPEPEAPIALSAITSGGSQAMFVKLNTFGEESFLDKLREII